MYNSTFQVSYRRKVYEEVATLAYQGMNKEIGRASCRERV